MPNVSLSLPPPPPQLGTVSCDVFITVAGGFLTAFSHAENEILGCIFARSRILRSILTTCRRTSCFLLLKGSSLQFRLLRDFLHSRLLKESSVCFCLLRLFIELSALCRRKPLAFFMTWMNTRIARLFRLLSSILIGKLFSKETYWYFVTRTVCVD